MTVLFPFLQIRGFLLFVSISLQVQVTTPTRIVTYTPPDTELSPIHLPERLSSNNDLGSMLESAVNSTLRRYSTPRDWKCREMEAWRDLGNAHYPRYIREVRCAGTTCFNGFYACREQTYQTHVLTARRSSTATSFVPSLPLTLRQSWMFETLPVSVGCLCVGN